MKPRAFNGRPRVLLLAPVYALLIFGALVTLVPFVWLVCSAVKANEDFFSSLFLPGGDGFLGVAWDRLTLANFKRLFLELGFGKNVLNSFFYSSVHAVLSTIICMMAGYALSKFDFPARRFLNRLVLIALVIPVSLLLAPVYQLLHQFRLLDSYAAVLLPGLAPAFGVFLFREAIANSVSNDLLESARIDGSGEARIFFSIVVPLVRPMAGAFLLLSFLGTWNNFISPQVVLQTPEKLPLAVAIVHLKGLYSQDYGMLMAGTLVSIAPVVCLFLLLQREFISGLTRGAVKE